MSRLFCFSSVVVECWIFGKVDHLVPISKERRRRVCVEENRVGGWVLACRCNGCSLASPSVGLSWVGSSEAGSQCVVRLRVVVMLFCFLSFWFSSLGVHSEIFFVGGIYQVSCCDFLYIIFNREWSSYILWIS